MKRWPWVLLFAVCIALQAALLYWLASAEVRPHREHCGAYSAAGGSGAGVMALSRCCNAARNHAVAAATKSVDSGSAASAGMTRFATLMPSQMAPAPRVASKSARSVMVRRRITRTGEIVL